MSQSTLNWALVIPTYKREAVLQQCLLFAAQQTYPPKEIIVVDASPDWEKTQAHIIREIVAKYPEIDWQYVRAKRASSAAQRNQGIELATAEIVFFSFPNSVWECLPRRSASKQSLGTHSGTLCVSLCGAKHEGIPNRRTPLT